MLMDSIPSPKDTTWQAGLKKKTLTICCSQETHLTDRNKHCFSVKGWKKIYKVNVPPKQTEVAILLSDKVDFKPKLVRRDKEGHFILIKGAIPQGEITMVNICAPNIGAPSFIKYALLDLQTQMNPNTLVLEHFSTPLLSMDRSSRHKIYKENQ
jgi:hypothetical protein